MTLLTRMLVQILPGELYNFHAPKTHQTVLPRTQTEPVALALPHVYALTRICSGEYIKEVENVFEFIAEPELGMPTHLRMLHEAVAAQRRLYRLNPEPLQEVDAWLAPFRQFWSTHVDALERHLDHMEPTPPKKKKTRRRK